MGGVLRARWGPCKKLTALVRLSIEEQYRNARSKPSQPPADASHPLAKLAQLVPQPQATATAPQAVLWRCNVPVWNHWCAVQTMWHSDSGVRTGLRVADVLAYLSDVAGLGVDERAETYALLQACEHEALSVYSEQRDIEEKERERKAAAR
ncbi:hypothetical protein BMF29_08505 [Comamonas kerstersii]|nr:hypothetical protein BMF38_08965 [Comamonas kerstersii]OOH92315.1 hypothetical protein BMF29_08505 [Comamonas kerstersii]